MPKAKTVTVRGPFSSQINQFVARLNKREGGDDSGRQMTSWTRTRNKNYWSAVIADERVLNTDDIASLASAFHIDGFTLIRAVRDDNINLVPRRNVVPLRETDLLDVEPNHQGKTPKKKAALEEERREDQGTSE